MSAIHSGRWPTAVGEVKSSLVVRGRMPSLFAVLIGGARRQDAAVTVGGSLKVLLSEAELRHGIERMAHEIRQRYEDRPLTIVGILTGSVVLLADLIRQLEMPLRVGVLQAHSYRGTERGELTINAEMMLDIQRRDVLLVDDIFDTGHTLVKVIANLQRLDPASVRSAVLLRKEGRQEVPLEPDFVGFDIPDAFVVGYGLDYEDHYRNLRYLATIEPDDLNITKE